MKRVQYDTKIQMKYIDNPCTQVCTVQHEIDRSSNNTHVVGRGNGNYFIQCNKVTNERTDAWIDRHEKHVLKKNPYHFNVDDTYS